MHVRVLGGFDVAAGGRSVAQGAWRLRKARTLVKLLALEPTHRLHRDRVEERLWPDLSPEATRNNFHQVLHAARKALSTIGVDGTQALALRDDLVVLGAACTLVTDLGELEAAVRAARTSGDHEALAAALTRWPGELLPGDDYEPWLQPHLGRFREWRSQLVLELATSWLDEQNAEAAVSLLAPVVVADPLHEPAHRAMMRALAASGRRSEALLVFERLREVLEQELAAEPEPETRQLFRALLTDRSGSSSAAEGDAAGDAAAPGNLPAPVVTLVGRDRELAEVAGILARTRLLTLTGPGGAGKTTLAVELARRRAADYPGGVFLVELGGLADSELVVPELAHSLGLELPSQAQAADAVVAQLRSRRVLVVLDNCEHLLDACARIVADLLRGCPGVTVLATSREPLRIEAEVAWRTPSLSLPDPAAVRGAADLSGVASVELFVRRATAAAPGFALTEDNAAAVAEVCYRLDGMPLALELAAACLPTLSPQQIADRLGDALVLLRRGSRAALTRQQTLEATLAWSHDLLGDEERRLFRRLAAFAGSFTLDAVESVCGEEVEPPQVLAALARLIDTSLVVADAQPGVTRYRLLETVRQFATEQLSAAGELAALQQRHCDWYVRFAQARDPERSSASVTVLPASLDVEHDNLRAALAWSLRHRPQAGLQLAVALWRYWLARGFFAEGRRWLEAALSAVPEPSVLRARALLALAVFDVRSGSDHRLAEIGTEAVDLHRVHGGADRLAEALCADAALAYMGGRWTTCWQRCAEARGMAAAAGGEQVVAAALHLQAMVLLGRGELAAAEDAFHEVCRVLAALPPAGPPFFLPLMLGYAVEGVPAGRPRLYFEETVLLGGRVGAQQAAAYVQGNLAYLARLAGRPGEAVSLLRQARARFAELGDRDGEALALNHLGCLHRLGVEYAEGRAAFERSLHLRRAIGDRRAIGLTLSNLGVLTAQENDVPGGIALLEQALTGFRETGDVPGRVATSLTAASVYADAGDCDLAATLLQEALPESEHIPGNHRATAWGYVVLSDVQRRLGRPEEAARAVRAAGELFTRLGAVDGAAYAQAHGAPAQSRR